MFPSIEAKGETTSLLDGDETARRCASLLDQQRKNDHLHPRLGDLVAVDQAFAAGNGFFNQRAVATRMRAAMPVSAQIEHPFPCFG